MKFKKYYSYHWYKLIPFYMIAIVVTGYLLPNTFISPARVFLIINLLALLIHQYEEYVYPSGGPVIINLANFNEKKRYMTYPGNMYSSMIVNHLAYVVYIMAIIFPNLLWLSIAIMFFNLFQLVGHGFKMNKSLGTWYNPGLASTILLLVPIALYYLISINSIATISSYLIGFVSFVVILITTTIAPVQFMKNENTPFPMENAQEQKALEIKEKYSVTN